MKQRNRYRLFLETLNTITLSEESDKSLEEEMKRFIDAHYHTRFDETLENGNDPLTVFDFEDIARHFAEWQKNQMLKDAVVGTVHHALNCHYIMTDQEALNARLRGIPEGTVVDIFICEAEEDQK